MLPPLDLWLHRGLRSAPDEQYRSFCQQQQAREEKTLRTFTRFFPRICTAAEFTLHFGLPDWLSLFTEESRQSCVNFLILYWIDCKFMQPSDLYVECLLDNTARFIQPFWRTLHCWISAFATDLTHKQNICPWYRIFMDNFSSDWPWLTEHQHFWRLLVNNYGRPMCPLALRAGHDCGNERAAMQCCTAAAMNEGESADMIFGSSFPKSKAESRRWNTGMCLRSR